MKIIDRTYLNYPFYGTPGMHAYLLSLGYEINIKKVERLYKIMNLRAIFPEPDLSEPNKRDKKYPYLLKSIDINCSNKVWSTDITYVPMENGFLYKVAFIDWYSSYLLSYSISNSMDAGFVTGALHEAIKAHGIPEIVNSDQGSQFTSEGFANALLSHKINISRDGKGRAIDNVMIERYWRSYKYECVYLHSITDGLHLKNLTHNYVKFYNTKRLHQSLDYETPLLRYKSGLILKKEQDRLIGAL